MSLRFLPHNVPQNILSDLYFKYALILIIANIILNSSYLFSWLYEPHGEGVGAHMNNIIRLAKFVVRNVTLALF